MGIESIIVYDTDTKEVISERVETEKIFSGREREMLKIL